MIHPTNLGARSSNLISRRFGYTDILEHGLELGSVVIGTGQTLIFICSNYFIANSFSFDSRERLEGRDTILVYNSNCKFDIINSDVFMTRIVRGIDDREPHRCTGA